ncbi:MAG: ABC transporter substrate-binding protein [Candidatus Bathyarchaeia archaeon]
MKKALICLAALLMALIVVNPVFAWTYWNCTSDTKFETFGPRVDKLLINLYSSDISEWESGLEGGEIDVTDWPLDVTHYNKYIADPRFKVLGYGAEFGLYLFDFNNNNNTFLGNPPNPAYPNPVFPNPMGYSIAESSVLHDNGWWLRAAIANLVDRETLVSYVGPSVATPIYTPVPPSLGKYSHPELQPGGSLFYMVKYDPVRASQLLNESGLFPYDPVSGWRYWDKNKNGQKDPGEDFSLKVFVRSDHAGRKKAGEMLIAEFERSVPLIRIPYSATFGDISAARSQVMTNKNFHIYTGGWSLGVDPDFLILWNWDFYWHPGRPYNYAGCNKDLFNEASYNVMYANTQADAVYWARKAQEVFADAALSAPLYSATGFKAVSRKYVGSTEPDYFGQEWTNWVNWPGYGVDNGYTFLNMHTNVSEWMPGGVIRYGFKTTDIRQFNPVYSEWLWDNTVLDLIGYESLLARNPYTLEFIPWVAKTFTVSTYNHPIYGECTKVVFTLRNDVYFQDGRKLTIGDIYFTFVEIDDILESRGLAPPWWISNVQNILSFSILDPMNFEVLLDVKSIYAVGWVGGNRILPEHIWRPLCETGDPSGFAPDPNLIGSGPWRLDDYAPSHHILLAANKPGSTVDTGLPGSQPVTSTYGFFRHTPAYVDIHTQGYKSKILVADPLTKKWALVTLEATVKNLMEEHVSCEAPQTTLTGEKWVWIDGTPLVENKTISLDPTQSDVETFPLNLTAGAHMASIAFHITSPTAMAGRWVNTTWPIYVTITEDISGTTYVNPKLPAPDIKVDMKDVAGASKAFGTFPGHARWNTVADINGDYKIDMKDIAGISKKFGWHG